MTGYRILAIILGLLCLLLPISLVSQISNWDTGISIIVKVEKMVLAEKPLADFLVSPDHQDMVVKNHLKYGLGGAAIFSLGMGLMFFISAFKPREMRPFIVVVIICSILLIPLTIWIGLKLNIARLWWIGDSISSLVLALLLMVFFPRQAKASARDEEEELTE